MAIIVVGGSSQGAGKTSLVCGLIAALPEFRWTAIKITTHDHGQPKPIWEETQPGPQTDTSRYLAAGAARAFLATPPLVPRSAEPDLPPMLDELWPHFGRGTNLIFESNSVVHHVRPNACLMIQAVSQRHLPLPERKPSFIAAIGHADAMVALSHDDAVTPEGLRLPDQEPKPIFLLAAFDRISPQMLAWLRPLLGSSAGDSMTHP
ncbi:MAG: hypothetical protein ABSF53_04180 [Terracidiphilus sp.]|jgi:hypothetical protein